MSNLSRRQGYDTTRYKTPFQMHLEDHLNESLLAYPIRWPIFDVIDVDF